MNKTVLILILFSSLLMSGSLAQETTKQDKTLILKLGAPDLKEKTMDIQPGLIYSAQTGQSLEFQEMVHELAKVRLVYVGESHNSLPMHQIQAKIIRALYQQEPELAIGMEMFTPQRQEPLNKLSLGLLTLEEFVQEATWYEAWNFNFKFYADIFENAKSLRIPIFGLNAPREIITKLRMRGWKALSDEEKALVPEPDVNHEEHRAYIRAVFEGMDMPHAMQGPGLDQVFEGLYRAQSAWDEVMSDNILNALEYSSRKMVVLAGSGHLYYNLGINRRAFKKSAWPFKTVICVVVPKDMESLTVSRSLSDFVWALPEEMQPAYPSLGLRLKKFEGMDNLVIERKPISGAAKEAGFEKGDVILSVDGQEYSSVNALRIYFSGFEWGDSVQITVLREAQVKTINVEIKYSEEGSF